MKFEDPSFDSCSGDTSEDTSFVVFENNESPNKNRDTIPTRDDSDSFIIFSDDVPSSSTQKETSSRGENSFNSVGNETVMAVEALQLSDHLKKKIDWKRPGRKHHSWDLTQNSSISLGPREPPVYLYIQMQLCQKESLKEWLGLNTNRNYEEMLKIFLQILDAVEYVHLRKLIHRDLKVCSYIMHYY